MKQLESTIEIHKRFKKIDKTKIKDLKEYILELLSSHRAQVAGNKMRIAIGTDSKFHPKKGRWSVSYGTVIAFTFGNSGTHLIMRKMMIHGEGKLSMFDRLWKEVELTVELGQWIRENCNFEAEIHLDVNPDQQHGSNILHDAAKGYAQSFGFYAETKPDSPIASCASDHFVRNKLTLK